MLTTCYVLFALTASPKTAKSPRPPKRKRSKDTESGTIIEATDMGKWLCAENVYVQMKKIEFRVDDTHNGITVSGSPKSPITVKRHKSAEGADNNETGKWKFGITILIPSENSNGHLFELRW